MRYALLLAAAVGALLLPSHSTAATQVFVLAGQSNMLGQDASGPNPSIGPAASFATAITAATGSAPTIVQCAVSGSFLSSWVPGGDLYQACLASTRQAVASGGEVAGVMFWQGESESGDQALATTWAARFGSFVSGFRGVFGADVPVVFAQLDTPTGVDPAVVPYWNIVQQQQASVSIARVSMVVTSDLPTVGEHVTATGYVTAGQRFAAAMVAWPRPAAPPPAPPTPPPAPAPPAPPTPVAAPVPAPPSGGGGPAPEPAPVVQPDPPPAPVVQPVAAAVVAPVSTAKARTVKKQPAARKQKKRAVKAKPVWRGRT